TLSASWMAESASSVTSRFFCGIFAMSVVASLLRCDCRRGPKPFWAQPHREILIRHQKSAATVAWPLIFRRQSRSYRLGAAKETDGAGRFPVIVNALFTITLPAAGQLRRI